MLQTLRAFAWLRWRTFVNSLERTGSRDMLERFSVAIERLGPVLAGIMLIPSALGLAVIGAASGYALAQADPESVLARAPRYILMVVPALAVFGPLLLPAADRTNPVRMLLLPISRGSLYVAQSAAALGDVWILLMLPLVTCIPLGMAVGGAPGAAVLAAISGVLLVAVVVAISSTTTSVLHLAVRDRRRGEVLALLFLLLVSVIGMLPSLAASRSRGPARQPGGTEDARRAIPSPRLIAAARTAFSFYPTELYAGATRDAAQPDLIGASRQVAGLALTALLLNVLGVYAFHKVLESPGTTASRSRVPMRPIWALRLPGLSPGASAVASAHVRLALRTPRGRAILLSPVVLVFVYFLTSRQGAAGVHLPAGLSVDTGLAFACFGTFVCGISILPIALNQFAVDKGGLTRTLLSPLSDRDYLAGKATGNALMGGLPSFFYLLAAYLLLPGTRTPASWAAIPVALVSVYCLVAPAAAAFSALFPRVVDLNSIGRASNAHGLAALLGMLTFVVAAVLTAGVAGLAGFWLRSPGMTLLILIAWCAIAFGISRLLFIPARRIFASRRDNLAML